MHEPFGSAYRAMGELLQEYGFGDALERKRSEVTRADLLRCMDHLTEIKTWLRRYPDQTVLNHPSVVWRRFKASEDGKRLLNARDGEVPAKQSKMARKVVDLEAEIEHLREQLAAAESRDPRPVADMAEVDATPLQRTAEEAEHEAVTEANVEAYTARRYAVADSETGTLIGDIEMARKAYVALLPTDPKVRRQELVALGGPGQRPGRAYNDGDVKQLRWELDLIETLDEPDPTPSPTRRTKKKTYPAKPAGMSRARYQAAGSPADPPATPPGLE
jgi:hypothetical protein